MIRFGREVCGDWETAIRREWWVTNGLGGYSSGTVAGAHTRRYHGLLVSALQPPLGRTVMLAKFDETAYLAGQRYDLSANEYEDGTIFPQGYKHLESFSLDGTLPVFRYAPGDALLEKRIWMPHGQNATYVTYTVSRASEPITLELTPLCTYRDFHRLLRGQGWQPSVVADGLSVRIEAFEGAIPYRLEANRGSFTPDGTWYWKFKYRAESERGQDDVEDLYAIGRFRVTLVEGETLALVVGVEPPGAGEWAESLAAQQRRQRDLIQSSPLAAEPEWIRQLVVAADQFIVFRALPDRAEPGDGASERSGVMGRTIIAGYPWFGDWGRDTMISLPGLTLATGHADLAAEILRTFARYISHGMLPNRWPDLGEQPEYNTVDASLWYFQAVDRYLAETGDMGLVEELYTALTDIVEWHMRGTRYNIHCDLQDGLLYAGVPGVQLTWMDAKVDDWVVTPRIGKPVEINALWYSALLILASFGDRLGHRRGPGRYLELATKIARNFESRFWCPEHGYLYDVVDGPLGDDPSLRPNQLFAVWLAPQLLSPEHRRAVVDVCAQQLLTSYGLRSLAPSDPGYVGVYIGDPPHRDAAYHQGTTWGWLIGPFVSAYFKVYPDAEKARSFLLPFQYHLSDAGLGTVSEIFDGDAPYVPRGCPAQAWSVAEVLRAWAEL